MAARAHEHTHARARARPEIISPRRATGAALIGHSSAPSTSSLSTMFLGDTRSDAAIIRFVFGPRAGELCVCAHAHRSAHTHTIRVAACREPRGRRVREPLGASLGARFSSRSRPHTRERRKPTLSLTHKPPIWLPIVKFKIIEQVTRVCVRARATNYNAFVCLRRLAPLSSFSSVCFAPPPPPPSGLSTRVHVRPLNCR